MTEIEYLRERIDPLIGQLEAVTTSPCRCGPCLTAASIAKRGIDYLSPVGLELALEQERDEAFFGRLSDHMRSEIERLAQTIEECRQMVCRNAPPLRPDISQPPVRKFAAPAKPRPAPAGRRTRGEMLKNPRIPGTFRLY
jgi:hypothetical protein